MSCHVLMMIVNSGIVLDKKANNLDKSGKNIKLTLFLIVRFDIYQ